MRILKNFLKKLYIKTDPEKYSLNYMGTFSFWRLLFLNIVSPGRTLNRIKYKQVFRNKNKTTNNFKKKLNLMDEENKISAEDKTKLSQAMSDLITQGGAVIPNYFSEQEIDNFIKEKNSIIENMKNLRSEKAEYIKETLELSDGVMKLWLDKKLTCLVSTFFGGTLYARSYPTLFYTMVPDISKNDKNHNSKVSDSWHLDHSVLFVTHVLLNDLTENDTCMEFIPGSHKHFTAQTQYSNKTIENYGTKPIKCVGKKGTVYMHSGNVAHRLKTISGSDRLNIFFDFSPGPNILLNCNEIYKCLRSGYDLNKLNEKDREIISGVFPRVLPKGYEVHKNTFFPTKFKGI